MPATYRHPDGTTWSIEQIDKQLVLETNGKSQTRKFVSAAHAETQLAKLVAEKLAAGFEVAELGPADVVVAPPIVDGLDPALVAQLLDDPYDAAVYDVLADALSNRGDPRGELCALMRADETKPTRKTRKAVDECMAENEDVLLGELADLFAPAAYDDGPLVWKHGYIHSVRLEYRTPLELATVLAHPSSRFLVELDFRGATPEIVATIAKYAPPALRVLELYARLDIGDLGALWAAMPRLRRVRIHAREFSVGTLSLAALERLELVARIMTSATVRAVTAARLPALERLALRFGGFRAFHEGRPDGAATADDVRALVSRDDLPKLTHLRLVRGFASEAAMTLAQAPLATQLVSLDLSGSNLDDRAAIFIAGKFGKLKELVATDNPLTTRGTGLLRTMATTFVDVKKGLVLGDDLDTQAAMDGPDLPSAAALRGAADDDDDDRFDEITE